MSVDGIDRRDYWQRLRSSRLIAFCRYESLSRAEDRATQGCAPSADSEAEMAGAAQAAL